MPSIARHSTPITIDFSVTKMIEWPIGSGVQYRARRLDTTDTDLWILENGQVWCRNHKGEHEYRVWHFKKITLNNKNAAMVSVAGYTTNMLVGRLVAMAFCAGHDVPSDRIEVNHVDENRANNDHLNLQWVTHKENMDMRTNKAAGKGDRYWYDVATAEYHRVAPGKSPLPSWIKQHPNHTRKGCTWWYDALTGKYHQVLSHETPHPSWVKRSPQTGMPGRNKGKTWSMDRSGKRFWHGHQPTGNIA